MIFQVIYLAKTSSIIVANSVANLWRILPAKRLRFLEVFGLMFTSLLLNKLEVFLLSLEHGNQSNSET